MRFLIVLPLTLLLLSGCTNNNEENMSSNVEISRIGTKVNQNTEQTREQELSSYTTKILTQEADRQKNISISCSELSGHKVEPGATFSFTDTLGPATPEKGYEKADVYEADGDIIQEYGGGKCQLSTTLYNAVLNTEGLKVIERHEHSRDVDYVPEGQDAAVAYGSVDFKFKNENSFPIKIYASTTGAELTVRIMKLF